MAAAGQCALLVFVAACADDSANGLGACTHPDKTTYQCKPYADGEQIDAMACHGGPTWTSNGVTTHEDPALVFPPGCHVELPICKCSYPEDDDYYCRYGIWQGTGI